MKNKQTAYEAGREAEAEYVNAYADFVDEMSVGTSFDDAFTSLNDKLSKLIDKDNLNNSK